MLKYDGPHNEANTVKIKEEIIFLSISGISNLSHFLAHLISILRYIITIYVRHVFQILFLTCENTNV